MIKLEANLRPRRRHIVATRGGTRGDIIRRGRSKWGPRTILPISKQGVDALPEIRLVLRWRIGSVLLETRRIGRWPLRERPKIQNSLVLVSSHAVRRFEEVNVRLLLPPVGRSKETRFFCSL